MAYIPTQWDTAAQKTRFERQFKKFVQNGFREVDFPNWFYKRLSVCFGFIAYCDRKGFYSTFFTKPVGRVRFVRQCIEHPCYGSPEFTYSDVETVLRLWLINNGFLGKLEEIFRLDQEYVERAELARLKAKYEGV